MDPPTAIALITPSLAALAITDEVTGLSTAISRRLRLADGVWLHAAMMLFAFAALIAAFNHAYPWYSPGTIIDYMYVERHRFSLFVAPQLLLAELFLIPLSVVLALPVSVWRRRNILGSVTAAALGNIGTIVWLIRGPTPARK